MNKKIVTLNGSPNAPKGTTAILLTAFSKGLEENGCEVTNFNVAKMDIKACKGDLKCWVKTDGDCVQDDDMTQINNAFRDADTLVLATPVYVDGMTGPLKNTLDRMVCQILPQFEVFDDHLRHPPRLKRDKPISVILLSTCGLWEMDNFDPLIMHVKAICKNLHTMYAGAVLRPHAPVLYNTEQLKDSIDDILSAASRAGKEFATMGEMSEDTLNKISIQVVDRDTYADVLNKNFERQIQKYKSRAE